MIAIVRPRLAMCCAASLAMSLLFFGCGPMPGRPGPDPEVVRPEKVLDFRVLYKSNCAGCHGDNGRGGAAISLANPVYLAVAGEGNLQHILKHGVRGTLMPAFGKSAGGTLTDQQVDVLVKGMLQDWGQQNDLSGQSLPSYGATSAGDPVRGQQAFTAFCSRCHGANGEGSANNANGAKRVGSIVDGSYLALISDQALRSIVIAGLPDRGMPDWRSDAAQPMTNEQITDIVAWLASKRVPTPGQPYPSHP